MKKGPDLVFEREKERAIRLEAIAPRLEATSWHRSRPISRHLPRPARPARPPSRVARRKRSSCEGCPGWKRTRNDSQYRIDFVFCLILNNKHLCFVQEGTYSLEARPCIIGEWGRSSYIILKLFMKHSDVDDWLITFDSSTLSP